RSGAVKVCKTGMTGAMGFTHDRIACMSVSHKMTLNVHLSTVRTAASKAGKMLWTGGSWPVRSVHVTSKYTTAVSQQATSVGQSIRFPEGTSFRIGITSQLVMRRTACEYGLNGCRRIA